MKLSDTLKTIRKSTGAVPSNKSELTKISDWISSGSYAINRAITGDIYKGFPQGRISVIYGESGSGKSMIVANTIIDALNNNKVDVVYYLDSEGGGLWNYFDQHGADRSKIEYITVADVEECKKALTNIYDTLDRAKKEYEEDPDNNDQIRAFVVLDSFGALSTQKSITDITDKGKVVSDMGSSARAKNDMMSIVMMRVVRTKCALLIVNHTYENPAAMFASKIKEMPGGKKLEYASHVKLQTAKRLIKTSNNDYMSGLDESTNDRGAFKGNIFRILCTKNRCSKPGFECEVYIDFDSGIQKWDGLIEDAVKYGYIQDVRGGYVVPSYSDKKITKKTLVSTDEIWKTFIDKFNEESIKKLSYSNSTAEALDEIEDQLDTEVTEVKPTKKSRKSTEIEEK